MTEPVALAVVAGMAVVTFGTKAGGLWLLDRLEPSDRVRDALDALPGGIIVAILVVRLLRGGPPEWGAAVVVIAVASRTDSIVLALLAGVGSVLALRGVLPAV